MKMYEVGGCVRDELLGVKSKDIDFSVVLEPGDMEQWFKGGVGDPFQVMVLELSVRHGITIIRDKDGIPVGAEFLTVRGIHPERGAVDFVLARKESDYTDGRRPDKVEIGTLMDDLARRDFTMNAIAKDADGSLIDPFNGVEDITQRIIRAVGDPLERLTEDALRAVRAFRFAVTKGFFIQRDLSRAMENDEVLSAIENNISDERIEAELTKAFRFNSMLAGSVLFQGYPDLADACFSGRVSLDATLKTKGRGK